MIIRPVLAWRAALLLAFAVATPAHAQQRAAHASRADTAADPRVDRIFAAYARTDGPGCAVGVVRDGKLVYQRGYGMADLDHDIPNGSAMVYYVGSISKQFTAAAVALLALDGRLSLDDPVRKWIPELPDYGATYGTPVTIRHLLHHTSGIRDIYSLMALRGDRMRDVLADSEALALIVRQKGLGFAPGTSYSYSNSGYFLLGQVVKRASGQSLREFADARIFAPLGMTHTHFHDDGMHVLKGRALSYTREGGNPRGEWLVAWMQNFDKTGAGGLWTTIDDLQKWDANYYTHQVGGDALQAMIHTRGMLANGVTLPYAFGNTVDTYRGLRITQHTGSLMGYQAYVGRYPDQRLSVLMTCNADDAQAQRMGLAVAEVYLGNRMTTEPKVPPAVAAAPRQVAAAAAAATPATPAVDEAALVGDYASDDLGVTYRVERLADGRLALSWPRRAPSPLVPVPGEAGRYSMAGGYDVRFERDGASAVPVVVLVLTVPRAGEMRMVRVAR